MSRLKRLKCNLPVYLDVDDTLIMWAPSQEDLDRYGIDFEHTYDNGTTAKGRLLPHRVHIRQLKRHSERGHTIIVWSAGGEEWAYAAVKALGLEDFVDYTMEKPRWAYDDKKANDFIETKFWSDDDGSKI